MRREKTKQMRKKLTMHKRMLAMLLVVALVLSNLSIGSMEVSAETSDESVVVGAFTVIGGTEDTDFSYSDGVLSILTGANLTVKNTDPDTVTNDVITVVEGITANITLAGVNIKSLVVNGSAAFNILSGATANITLQANTTNILEGAYTNTSSPSYAGLSVPETATLIITEESLGILKVTGGKLSAGIGGNSGEAAGDIYIHGGVVIANAGNRIEGTMATYYTGAGIGGGRTCDFSSITITGGTVSAYGDYAMGAGGGYSSNTGTIKITGGNVLASASQSGTAMSVTPTNEDGDAVYLSSFDTNISDTTQLTLTDLDGALEGYNVSGIYSLSSADVASYYAEKISVYTTTGVSGFTYKETTYSTLVSSSEEKMYYDSTDFIISGDNLIEGTDYDYIGNMLYIYTDKAIAVSQKEGIVSTNYYIIIDTLEGVTANVTIKGLNIQYADEAPIYITEDSSLNLWLEGENILEGYNTAAIQVSEGAALTIDAEDIESSITATVAGSTEIATIGGGGTSIGSITINGGTVSATGCMNSPGIGGGPNTTVTSITINGGIIYASGGQGAAGIGGAYRRGGGTILITGGVIYAEATEDKSWMTVSAGAAIGSGGSSTSNSNYSLIGSTSVTITGGTITANVVTTSNYNKIPFGNTSSSNSSSSLSISNAVIYSNYSISHNNKSRFTGVFFENSSTTGTIYGSPEFDSEAVLNEGYSFTISEDKSITVAEDGIFSNAGTIYNYSDIFIEEGTKFYNTETGVIYNYDTIDLDGTLYNDGVIYEYGTTDIDESTGEFVDGTEGSYLAGSLIVAEWTADGDEVDYVVEEDTVSVSINVVDTKENIIEGYADLISVSVNDESINCTATDSTTFTFAVEDLNIGANTVVVNYTGTDTYSSSTLTFTISKKTEATIATPTASSIGALSVQLDQIGSGNYGTVYYGYSLTDDIDTVENWTSTSDFGSDWYPTTTYEIIFDGLEPETTYYFFAKADASGNYTAPSSESLEVTTAPLATLDVESFDITTSSIVITDSSKDGYVYVTYNGDTYELVYDDVSISGNSTATTNTITVDSAVVEITLDNVYLQATFDEMAMWEGGDIEVPISLENGADVTITLVGENKIESSSEVWNELPAISLPDGTKLTINGEGSLTIQNGSGYLMYGIGTSWIGEWYGYETGFGELVIAGGDVSIDVQDYAITSGSGATGGASITVTGGTLTVSGSISLSASTGDVEFTVTGGDVTLNNNVSLSASDGDAVVTIKDSSDVTIASNYKITTEILSIGDYYVEYTSNSVTYDYEGNIYVPSSAIITCGEFTLTPDTGITLTAVGEISIPSGATIIVGEDSDIAIKNETTEAITMEIDGDESELVVGEGLSIYVDDYVIKVTGKEAVISDEGVISYYVTYTPNNGSDSYGEYVNYGETFVLPTVSYTGYTLNGWYIDADFTDEYDADDKFIAVQLYASWSEIKAISIEIVELDNYNMGIDDTLSLEIEITPEDALLQDVEWTTSDDTVATVSSEGVVTGHKTGAVDIIATLSSDTDIYYKITINVNPTCIVLVDGVEVEVAYGELLDEPEIPTKDGYYFIGWEVDGEIWDFDEDIVTEDVELVPIFAEKILYDVDGVSVEYGAGEKVVFTIDAEYSEFISLYHDGNEVSADNYTVVQGSTIITLQDEYISTFAIGEHVLTAVFEKGTAELTLLITEAADTDAEEDSDLDIETDPEVDSESDAESDAEGENANTGDENLAELWCIMIFASLLGILAITKKKYKLFV